MKETTSLDYSGGSGSGSQRGASSSLLQNQQRTISISSSAASSNGVTNNKNRRRVGSSSSQQQQPQPQSRQRRQRRRQITGSRTLGFHMVLLLFQIMLLYHPTVRRLHQQEQQEHKKRKGFDQDSWNLQDYLKKRKNTNATTTKDDNPILALLRAVGVPELTADEKKSLPSWKTVTTLYGATLSEGPVIIGMETCQRYRQHVPQRQRYTGVAGLFNSGTNAMMQHLRRNIATKTFVQVPWGKHRMEFVRLHYTADNMRKHDLNQEYALPIVMIRDPYHWMHSMCKSPYSTKWHRWAGHCPNLVPTEDDRLHFQHFPAHIKDLSIDGDTFPVKVVYDRRKDEVYYWDSLAHLWNDWYQRYVQADYPRLMIRFEDMLLHGPTVMKKIAECTGSSVPPKFTYRQESAKKHGSGSTFLDAIEKMGNTKDRVKSMTREDLDYARTHLDDNLMRLFQYKHPEVWHRPQMKL